MGADCCQAGLMNAVLYQSWICLTCSMLVVQLDMTLIMQVSIMMMMNLTCQHVAFEHDIQALTICLRMFEA